MIPTTAAARLSARLRAMGERAERAGATSIDPVLAELAGEHRDRVPEALAALELLAGLLTPELSADDPELSPSDVHQPLEEAQP